MIHTITNNKILITLVIASLAASGVSIEKNFSSEDGKVLTTRVNKNEIKLAQLGGPKDPLYPVVVAQGRKIQKIDNSITELKVVVKSLDKNIIRLINKER